jgi:DNA-binding SARP family transcriptional activator
MIELRVLGVLEVRVPDAADALPPGLTQPKRLALLLYLALAEPQGLHSRDRLLALLWPEADAESARHSLRNALHALRRGLGEDAIVLRGHAWVGIDAAAIRCDALELRAHLAAGEVDQSLALWRGDLAAGFHVSGAPDFERWLDDQRETFRGSVRRAAWRKADEARGKGGFEIDAVRRAVRLDPGNEPGVRRLMLLLSAAGDRGGALDAYQELADYFTRELEALPSSETRALAATLRTSGPHPVPPDIRHAESTPLVPPVEHQSSAAPVSSGRSRWGALARAGIALSLTVILVVAGRPLFSGRPPATAPQPEVDRAVLRVPARYRTDTSAYSSYLRALSLRFRFKFLASRDTLIALVDREPLYVPGLYGLAHAWIFSALNNLTDPGEAWSKVDVLARRAIALDSTAGSAWLALASQHMYATLDLPRARAEIEQARALDPLDPDVAGMLSVWHRFHGQMDSAVIEAKRAHELDPTSLFFNRLLGKQLYFAHRFEESHAVYRAMLHDHPDWTRGYVDMAELFRAMGRPRDAVEWLSRTRAAAGDTIGSALLAPVASDSAAQRLLRADARREIKRLLQESAAGTSVPAGRIAAEYANLGDTTATFHWIDSVLTQHDSYMPQIRLDPRFDFLRGDARYREWEKRSGLPALAVLR